MDFTISYSKDVEGWTSFHSYIPEWMVNMNGVFYSFKNGNLWQHYSNNTRNNYYGVQYSSEITPILNDSPIEQKVFKTISTQSTTAWKAECDTQTESGVIESSYFVKKETNWYSHIRRDPNTLNNNQLSTQGIGTLNAYNALVLSFTFFINSSLSTGDKVYILSGGNLTLLGTVASHTLQTITLSSIGLTIPVNGDMIVFSKDSTAESYPLRGNYMKVKLTNTSTDYEEIFTVSSNVFKSFI